MNPNFSDRTVVVIELQSEENTPQVLQVLRERKPVVLNLTQIDASKAQRIADCVAGFVCAIDGHTTWLGEQTFLFAPSYVQVTATLAQVNSSNKTQEKSKHQPSKLKWKAM